MGGRRDARKGCTAGCLVVWTALGTWGCGADGAPGDASLPATDSAGIPVVRNTWVESTELPEWRLEETPFWAVGHPAPSPEYELFNVAYPRSFPDGRVSMTLGAEEVRIFGPEGEHLLTFGGRGEGPGEFAALIDAHPLGDSAIQAFDGRLQRVSVFDARSGELLGSHNPEPFVLSPNGAAPLPDGSFAGLAMPSEVEVGTVSRILARWGPGGTPVDTLGVLSRAPTAAEEEENVRSWFFGRFWSTTGGDRVWAGFGSDFEIVRYHRDGTLEQVLRSTMPGIPVSEEMRATAPELPAGFRWDHPERLPLFGKLLASPSGWLWVRHYISNLERDRSEFRTWDIYDPEGRQAASIRIPVEATINEVGDDYVLGIFPNELDVEVVAKYRIVKPGGG